MWYNLTAMKNNTTSKEYFIPYQLKMPLEISVLIDMDDPIYSFNEVMNHIDLNSYVAEKGCGMGRPRCDSIKLLKIILFAFMEGGYETLRGLNKLCRTDIRYMWLRDGMPAPSHATFGNFIRNELSKKIEDIFADINSYIFRTEGVDLEHAYIDGTKIEANANKYTWVWKKSCITNRNKVFEKITNLLERINTEVLFYFGVKLEPREEYAVEYVELLLQRYVELTGCNCTDFVSGKGKRKSTEQKHYEELQGYLNRLRKYSEHIHICGEERNSYSKTDHDATFLRMKKDYMGNDQLLPGYNMQMAICDEYIAAVDVKSFASDTDCFIPLMEKFKSIYGHYPRYPIADAGYGSYNNYLFCEKNGMEKYMKFTMYDKTVNSEKYRNDPFRAVNFKRDEAGNLICPNGKKFVFQKTVPVKGNKYERTEEIYVCEDCSGCPLRNQCTKGRRNRTIRLNEELTSIHEEVLANLESVHGALLRMNRSIQAEGTYGVIKWDRRYDRAYRRGLESIELEFLLISCGFNLYKYHNKKNRAAQAA